MPKWAWLSLLSLAIGIPIFIPPSSSTSPALQRLPSKLSCPTILPLDLPRALHQSMTTPIPPIVIIVILLVAVVVKLWLVVIDPNVDADDSGYIGMGMGHVFEAVAAVGPTSVVVIVIGGGRTLCRLI
ncbi:hypothetical protein EV421DRAFT_1742274 [Armillaria borealis]|uniref:Uncharacterized protein n=1 Tax=Armillaria borealis TaxID=47425 RepID=A0AA39IXY2_9AGAR|nr:hypothetical protein EV421DRAFT_1742274 [Armillaria borealis]